LFVADARERFQTEPDAPAAREVIRREAHTFGGSAGLLGFLELAEACRALEAAPASDSFDRALDRCRRERDAALRTLTELMPDDTLAKEQQASA